MMLAISPACLAAQGSAFGFDGSIIAGSFSDIVKKRYENYKGGA
jgi:hypothetical protein